MTDNNGEKRVRERPARPEQVQAPAGPFVAAKRPAVDASLAPVAPAPEKESE